ncbi:MAG: hypothetical protein GF332_00220 [Candidatus Moranbacteria bacterium]|nr:hypothetical protein [Candidatus Moranbacteria bacterium]
MIKKHYQKIIGAALFLLLGLGLIWNLNLNFSGQKLIPTAQAKTVNIKIVNWLKSDEFEQVLINILARLRTFVAALAIIMFVIAGIIYVFSQGEENRVTLAKKMIIGAVIGLLIILAAESILKELYTIFDRDDLPTEIKGAKEIWVYVQNILNLLLSLLGMIGIISLIYAGVVYLTSGGNQERAETAKKQMIYSIIGLFVAIGSMIIVKQIDSLLK